MILLKSELHCSYHGAEIMSRSANLFAGKEALLLDMNGTFMFGEDRFGLSEDFSVHYSKIGGKLSPEKTNSLVCNIHDYLSARYTDEKFRHDFSSVEQALFATAGETFEYEEAQRIIATFAHHELGSIPASYAQVRHALKQRFVLGAVIDIWSPKAAWLDAFERSGIDLLFEAMSFSSDHGMVKPSPRPFQLVLDQLNISNSQSIVIGDSPRRDLGGAKSAGIDCILVGGATHQDALGTFGSLLELFEHIAA